MSAERAFFYHHIQVKRAEQRAFWQLFLVVWGGCLLMLGLHWIILPCLILLVFNLMGIHIHRDLEHLKRRYNSLVKQKYEVAKSAENCYH